MHVASLLVAFEAERHVEILVEFGRSGRALRDAHSSQKRDEWGTQCYGFVGELPSWPSGLGILPGEAVGILLTLSTRRSG